MASVSLSRRVLHWKIRACPCKEALADQPDTQRAIRAFLKVRTTYDVLPLSYRLIVLDTALLVRKSLNILIQCGTFNLRSKMS